jgi:hypothetical protein
MGGFQVNKLNILVDQGRLIVHPRCKLLIQTLKNGIWDKNREEFAHSEIGLGHMDAIAALIYLHLAFESYYNQNPIPMAAPTFTNLDLHGTYGKEIKNEWSKVFPETKKDDLEDQLPFYEDEVDY